MSSEYLYLARYRGFRTLDFSWSALGPIVDERPVLAFHETLDLTSVKFMKGCFATCRTPFAIALLIAGLAQASTVAPGLAQEVHLSGFLDISFGSTRAEAQDAMLRHEGVMLDPIDSDENNLIFDGGTFAGLAAGFWVLGFVDDQMHTAKTILQPSEDHLLATYEKLLALFRATYGEPARQAAFFDDPYEKGDGFESYAISFGKGHFAALWTFSDGKNENAISISIDKDLYIPIVFQSGRLIELALARQHQATTTGP